MLHKPKNSIALQIIIATGLSVVIISLLIIVGIDTKSIAGDIIEARTEIDARAKQSREIIRLREEAAIAEDKQKVLEGVLPQKDELFLFPNQITKIGTEKSVGTSFGFGQEGDGQIGYNLVAQGSYTNITEFLKVLENDIQFINILSFGLVSMDNGYDVNLNGNVFFNAEEG